MLHRNRAHVSRQGWRSRRLQCTGVWATRRVAEKTVRTLPITSGEMYVRARRKKAKMLIEGKPASLWLVFECTKQPNHSIVKSSKRYRRHCQKSPILFHAGRVLSEAQYVKSRGVVTWISYRCPHGTSASLKNHSTTRTSGPKSIGPSYVWRLSVRTTATAAVFTHINPQVGERSCSRQTTNPLKTTPREVTGPHILPDNGSTSS